MIMVQLNQHHQDKSQGNDLVDRGIDQFPYLLMFLNLHDFMLQLGKHVYLSWL